MLSIADSINVHPIMCDSARTGSHTILLINIAKLASGKSQPQPTSLGRQGSRGSIRVLSATFVSWTNAIPFSDMIDRRLEWPSI